LNRYSCLEGYKAASRTASHLGHTYFQPPSLPSCHVFEDPSYLLDCSGIFGSHSIRGEVSVLECRWYDHSDYLPFIRLTEHIGPESVNAVDKLQVLTTITNTGDEKVKVLNDPYGPLSPLPTDTFTITNASGAKPAFTGIKAKYLPAVAVLLGAYTELGPGQSTGVLHNRS